jgi:hypothetical protein
VELAPENDYLYDSDLNFVELALQTDAGTGWYDVATQRVYYYAQTGLKLAELQATMEPYRPVRLEIRAWRNPQWLRYVYFTKARLFGAQCYPDFSNPGSCL